MPATLATPRLILRPLRESDLDAVYATVASDPTVTWSGNAQTLDETRDALAAKLRHSDRHGYGMLAVIDRTNGDLLGYAGLQHLEDGSDVELGYYLGQHAWGRGLGTEAARAVLEHGFEALGLRRVVAVVRPENDRSKAVLSKLGLQFDHRAHHYGADVEVWAIARA